MRTLIVEDDGFLRYTLSEELRKEGFLVDVAEDGEKADVLVATQEYDAIVLDLGLPKVDGMTLLKRWRHRNVETPVLILTARSSWHQKVEGLDAGADDYLGKPFVTAEIVARLRALIRRAAGELKGRIEIGDAVIDTRARTVTRDGDEVSLTSHEYLVLEYLATHAGKVISKKKLADHIYDLDRINESNTIEVFIGRLRHKLGRGIIETVRGLGYRIADVGRRQKNGDAPT